MIDKTTSQDIIGDIPRAPPLYKEVNAEEKGHRVLYQNPKP